MNRRIITLSTAAVALLSAAPALIPSAHAQNATTAQTVGNCGTPNNTPVIGNPYAMTMDTHGNLCVAVSVTTGNVSVGNVTVSNIVTGNLASAGNVSNLANGNLTSAGNVTVLNLNNGNLTGGGNIGGLAANNASTSGNPVQISGLAESAEPTLATNGQNASIALDLAHRQIVFPYANKENIISNGNFAVTTVEVAILAAPGANLYDYITDVECWNSSATTVEIALFNGNTSTDIFSQIVPAGGGFGHSFPVPKGGVEYMTSNTGVFASIIGGGNQTSVVCDATGFKGS